MSNTYTNLTSLSVGADSASGSATTTLDSSGLSVTTVKATGYTQTTMAAATPAASITALPCTSSFYRMNSTIAVGLKGITAGVDGQRLELYFKSASNLTITGESTAATAINRITLMTTAATAVTTATGYASLIYSSTDSRWLLKYLTT